MDSDDTAPSTWRVGEMKYSGWDWLARRARCAGTGSGITSVATNSMMLSQPRTVPRPQFACLMPLSRSVHVKYTRGTPSVLKSKSGSPRSPSMATHSGGVRSTSTPGEYEVDRSPTPFCPRMAP